jgi:hypothetical protein
MATAKKTVKKAQRGLSRASHTTYDPKKRLYTQLDKFKHSDGDRYYRSTSGDQQIVGDMNMMGSYGNAPDSVRYSTLSPREKKVMDEQKNGGKVTKSKTVKAKDGKWIQKATASIKKRGTEGKCTPITKPGCTGKAKALAKTFKKIAAKRKAK